MPKTEEDTSQGNAAEKPIIKKDLLQAPEEETTEVVKETPVEKVTPVKETDELKELKKELKKRDAEIEQLEMKAKIAEVPQESPETQQVLENLAQQIKELQDEKDDRPIVGFDGKRQKYRKAKPSDVVPPEDAVVFIARFVFFTVGSYMDEVGVEHIAPFKMIKFHFAAADIKRDGLEETIINFCTYTTRLQPEIDFLRDNPAHGLSYSESMKDVADMDHKEQEFKSKVATEVGMMSTETIIDHAKIYKIPDYERKSTRQLRPLVASFIVKEYVVQTAELKKNQLLKMQLQSAV